LRVLILTKLFPNAVNKHGMAFNRQQFVALSRLCDVEMFGLIPWFPGAQLFSHRSDAGRWRAVPSQECIDGLNVSHPRALFFPRFGHAANPWTFALSLLPAVWPLRKKVDVILGSWAYPDGVAAILLGRWLRLPVVVKVHGSDLNSLPDRDSIRRVLARGLPRANRLVAVSRALAAKAREFGVAADRIALVPNGVDRALFRPCDRTDARRELELPDGRLLLFVGRLEASKGVLDLLQAFEKIAHRSPELRLAVVGDGTETACCREAQSRWPGRIFVPGAQPLAKVARWIAACDVLTLPSWNEGSPNVVIEAIASGRRVVASRVGGIPDMLDSAVVGEMVAARRPDELAEALSRAAQTTYDPLSVAAAGPVDWHGSARVLLQVLLSARDGSPLPKELRVDLSEGSCPHQSCDGSRRQASAPGIVMPGPETAVE
jgi:glycosyltransferase involved in cell wall biosynthesis